MNKVIETVEELLELDHEVPGMPDFTVSDELIESKVLEVFETYHNVYLLGDALIEFKGYIDDVYGTNP